jgi:hypothetical protein
MMWCCECSPPLPRDVATDGVRRRVEVTPLTRRGRARAGARMARPIEALSRGRRRALRIAMTSAHGGVGYSAKSHPCQDKEIHHGFSCLQDHSSYWYFDLKRRRRGADGGGTSRRHGAQSQMVQSHGDSRLHQGRKDCSMAGFCRPWLRTRVTFASGCVPSAGSGDQPVNRRVPRGLTLWFMPTRLYTAPAPLEYCMDGTTSYCNHPRHGAAMPATRLSS